MEIYSWADPQERVQTNSWNGHGDRVKTPTGSRYTEDSTDLTRYFVTWIFAPSSRSGQMWVGAHDDFKLWSTVPRPAAHQRRPQDSFRRPVQVAPQPQVGVETFRFQTVPPLAEPYTSTNPNDGSKSFSLRFVTDAAGTPMTDLPAVFDRSCIDTSASGGLYSRLRAPNIAQLAGSGGRQWPKVPISGQRLAHPLALFLARLIAGNEHHLFLLTRHSDEAAQGTADTFDSPRRPPDGFASTSSISSSRRNRLMRAAGGSRAADSCRPPSRAATASRTLRQ